MRISLAAVIGVAMLVCVGEAQDFKARAIEIHKQTPLIDGHNDYPWALRDLDPGRDLAKADITKPVPKLMTDIPRLPPAVPGGVGLCPYPTLQSSKSRHWDRLDQ